MVFIRIEQEHVHVDETDHLIKWKETYMYIHVYTPLSTHYALIVDHKSFPYTDTPIYTCI